MSILADLKALRPVSRRLQSATEEQINTCLQHLAELTETHIPELLAANQLDLDRMAKTNPKYDRLLLNEARLRAIAADLRRLADLPSPLGETQESRTLANGLELRRISVPIGVVGIVFESRPNVTFDVFALTLKSGNVSVLKGSRDAADSNRAIKALIDRALLAADLNGACYLAAAEREALEPILKADGLLDVIIPRGSQALIDYVRAHARVPVIETGAGICHIYVDQQANLDWAKAIITNAKARRVSVCNALDCLLLHHEQLPHLPQLLKNLGQSHSCEVFADPTAHAALQGKYPEELLHPATEAHFGTEFLSMRMSVRTVNNLEEALDLIDRFGSCHSEAIVTDNAEHEQRFLQEVDAAVVYANSSTAFTDGGEFELGAEIGISTQKLHARGPMGLAALTSYKYLINGAGHTR